MFAGVMHFVVVLAAIIAIRSLAIHLFNKRHTGQERTYPLCAALRTRYVSIVITWVGAFFCAVFFLQLIAGGEVRYEYLLGAAGIAGGWLGRTLSTHWIAWERQRLE